METLDLAALDTKQGAEAGFEVQLTHPQSGVALPIWVTVIGADADSYQKALRAQQRRRSEKVTRGRRVPFEDLDEDALDLLAAVTRGWRATATLDGQPFPQFSLAAAKNLYRRFPWIREQVDTAMGDRGNFLPKPAEG